MSSRNNFNQITATPKATVNSVLLEARNISFPWEDVFDPTVSAWLECMARARRAQPEFLVGPLLAMTSVLIGPRTVIQATHFFKEPANIFTLTLCDTGAAKSAAYKIAVDDPLTELSGEIGALAFQDYTRKGLMQHLVQHSGRAIIVYPEMSEFLDLVLKKQNDLSGERQLYCKLFDGSKWTDTRIGKESNRVEVDNLCVSVDGFAQPSVYLDQLMSLVNRNDGFLERFLTWVVKPHLINCDEVRHWGERLLAYSMQQFQGKFFVLQKKYKKLKKKIAHK